MTDVYFSGTFYLGGGLLCREPGRYTTNDAFAQFLVTTYPRDFSLAEPEDVQKESNHSTQVKTPETEQKPAEDMSKVSKTEETPAPVSLAKANRTQLEAMVADIGLDVTEELDTNAKLRQAIEDKHAK